MVATNIGAGQRERLLRTAWIGTAIAAALREVVGLAAAAWLSFFDSDPHLLEARSACPRAIGPAYGLFGMSVAPYFVFRGASLAAFAVAAGGGFDGVASRVPAALVSRGKPWE